MVIRRGDIFYADLRPVIGSEQGGVRPVLIIQNDVGNRHSPTVICAAITSQMNKAKLPTHVELDSRKYDLVKDSVVLLEQLRILLEGTRKIVNGQKLSEQKVMENEICLYHPYLQRKEQLSFLQILLDERYAEGYLSIPAKVLRKCGYLNERLPSKRLLHCWEI